MFLSEESFYFGTYTDEENYSYKSVEYSDIEGVWSFVYFSYSNQHKKVVGYLKVGASPFRVVTIKTTH